MLNWILFAALCVLCALDIITTRLIVAAGGKELNRYIKWLVSKIGWTPGLLVPKAIPLAAIGYFIYAHSDEPLLLPILITLVLLYTFIVARHFGILGR